MSNTFKNFVKIMARGTLIVLEGCDRAGKTTQGKMIVETLKNEGKEAVFMRFPG